MSVPDFGSRCCGCRACLEVCQFQALSFAYDADGFERIRIDSQKCRHCGMCEKVCPMVATVSTGRHNSCGAAYALDDQVKYEGSSGGLFGVFARKIVSEGGIVFGAAFDEDLQLKTTPAETEEQLIPLYKSKYLLCDTDHRFPEMKRMLESGRPVLYCSSPCQIAALRLFLKKDYENLITVDFVCHGVGSQDLFNRSIRYAEEKGHMRIRKVIFRQKVADASSHYYTYVGEKKGKTIQKDGLYMFFPYYYAYQKRYACRNECYDCSYASEKRVADITIGDFHTIEAFDPSIDRFAGVSMFVCHTPRGESFFQSVTSKLFVETFDWEILKKSNRFGGVEIPPANREAFLKMVAEEPFEHVVRRYLNPYKNWRLIYYKSPAFIRKFARKRIGK